jgi:hypothetical protein
MKHKLIPWHGKTYRAVEIIIFPGTDREESVTVSTEELEDELLEDMRHRNGADAVDLDDTIFYYVTSEEIKLPEGKIRKIVENALSE